MRIPPESGTLREARPRRVIRDLDSRYVVPKELDPIRVLLVRQEPNNDGSTSSHYVYVTLCEEVSDD